MSESKSTRPDGNKDSRETSQRPVHPICQDAPEPEKCQHFVERLAEAGENIDRRHPSP